MRPSIRHIAPFALAAALAPAAAPASVVSTRPRPAASRPHPQLRLQPTVVLAGARLTLLGSGFRPTEKVWLGVGPPRSEALHWGSARTNRAGGFRKTLTVNPRVGPGRWIAVACQRGCRIRATASFRTTRGRG